MALSLTPHPPVESTAEVTSEGLPCSEGLACGETGLELVVPDLSPALTLTPVSPS